MDKIKRALKIALIAGTGVEFTNQEAEQLLDELSHLNEFLHDAKQRIAALESQLPRWISVEERLPENDGDVLCRIELSDQKFTEIRHYLINQDLFIDVAYGEKITHWMPLPEPPEGE